MMTIRPALLCGFCLCSLLALAAPSAKADDAPKPLGPEFCIPTADMTKMLGKFAGLKASKRDTVGPDFRMSIETDEGEAMPERVELRDGEAVMPIAFDDMGRSVGLQQRVLDASEDASLCIVDPARAERTFEAVGYTVDFGMAVRFKETPGTHSMEEIEDGLKDGRSHYKKMVGAMGFMVPKFDHIAVAGDDEDTPPTVMAMRDGQDIGAPDFERHDGARLIAMETLEDMGADGIRVIGDYRMSPSPDAETVAKFSGGDEGD